MSFIFLTYISILMPIGCYLLFDLLGSKDLGFYVFRNLMCIVGKP